MSKLKSFFEFQRNYNLHEGGEDFDSEDYNCDRNIFNCSSSIQEALLLRELLTNAYAISGFGESYLIRYLDAYISKEEMYRLLILASDPEVRDLRLKREKSKPPTPPKSGRFLKHRRGIRDRVSSYDKLK